MSYQYFNIVNKKTLFLNGPKKWEAYILFTVYCLLF